RRWARPHPATTRSDLLSGVDDERALPPHVRDVASRLEPLARDPHEPAPRRLDDESFRRAIFAGYPDRVARRRAPGSPRFLLTSGHGAALGRESGVRDAEFIVAVDVHAGRRGENAEATIRIASAIDVAWLRHQIHGTHGLQPDGHAGSALTRVVDHEYDAVSGRVRAIERERYGAIVLTERSAKVDAEVAARLLAQAWRARGWSDEETQLLRRMRFAGMGVDEDELLLAAAYGRRSLAEVD